MIFRFEMERYVTRENDEDKWDQMIDNMKKILEKFDCYYCKESDVYYIKVNETYELNDEILYNGDNVYKFILECYSGDYLKLKHHLPLDTDVSIEKLFDLFNDEIEDILNSAFEKKSTCFEGEVMNQLAVRYFKMVSDMALKAMENPLEHVWG